MNEQQAGVCPYCGDETNNLTNHVRLSGGDHGDPQSYPEGWNDDEPADAEPVEQDDHAGGGGDREPDHAQTDADHADDLGDDLDLDEQDDESPTDPAGLFDDDPADAREYECGNCGGSLPYLGGDDRDEGGKECPECGERLFWSMME